MYYKISDPSKIELRRQLQIFRQQTDCLPSRNLLAETEICKWIFDLGDTPKVGDPPVDLVLVTNIKNFLRSLYFRILPNDTMKRYIEPIQTSLNGELFRL